MDLTREQTEQDIQGYQGRLRKVQQRLDDLPLKGRIPFEGRKLKATRQQLEADIRHIRRLIGYAEGALSDYGKSISQSRRRPPRGSAA